ncbi:MAG: MFS transporter [Chloroflexota bacterium]
MDTSSLLGRHRASVAVAFAAFALLGLNDGAFGVLLPSLMAHYGIGRSTAGLLFLALNAGYLPCVALSGVMYERLGRRTLQGLGALIFTVAAASCASMPPFAPLLVAYAGLGFGIGIFDAGLNAYIAGLAGSTGLMNDLHACYGAGALFGPAVASATIASGLGWNVTYVCWAGAGALVLAGFAGSFDRAERARHDIPSAGQSAVRLGALRSRIAWLTALVLLVCVGTEGSLGTWSFSLLRQNDGIGVVAAGWMVSGYWAGLTLGRMIFGRLAARYSGHNLALACFPGVMAGVGLLWAAPNAPAAALGLLLAGFSLGPIFPTTIAGLSNRIAPRLQASAIGFAVSLGSIGATTLPWLAGDLTQRVGLWALMPFALTLTVITFALWVQLSRSDGSRPASGPFQLT